MKESSDTGSEAESDEDTSVTNETKKMKDYFKKSHIYKKFEGEKIKEKLEDEEASKVDDKMDAMQSKYMDLMKKYGFVLAQVNK